ncbi:MAG: anaerobic ribonucleoside-triphosphate reductase activating protein [Bacilli bacterium]|nr:anaerobic ribonucleoside-triphosphate reductase activating protein [Bacilli bacterium]MDD4809289.1 anaerobic ribonucleoside-triphosphate reductase activating protein [Bacilli bacterium]
MKIRLARPLQSDSIVDGEGMRTVIWTQGCIHNCLGCHNPATHSFHAGTLYDIEEVKEEISKLKGQDGITLSGGDPMCQVEACLEIAKYCKSIGLNIWCYTGYTFEQLLDKAKKEPQVMELLKMIDVLVDGKFILEQKSLNLRFKGSRNQRILDVEKSLKHNRPYLIPKYKYEKTYQTPKEQCKYIYV